MENNGKQSDPPRTQGGSNLWWKSSLLSVKSVQESNRIISNIPFEKGVPLQFNVLSFLDLGPFGSHISRSKGPSRGFVMLCVCF